MEPMDEIPRSIGRLEGKVDLLLLQFREHREEVKDVNKRLSVVEQDAHFQRRAASTLGAIAGAVVTSAIAFMDPLMKWLKGGT